MVFLRRACRIDVGPMRPPPGAVHQPARPLPPALSQFGRHRPYRQSRPAPSRSVRMRSGVRRSRRCSTMARRNPATAPSGAPNRMGRGREPGGTRRTPDPGHPAAGAVDLDREFCGHRGTPRCRDHPPTRPRRHRSGLHADHQRRRRRVTAIGAGPLRPYFRARAAVPRRVSSEVTAVSVSGRARRAWRACRWTCSSPARCRQAARPQAGSREGRRGRCRCPHRQACR
jgi:hypothetical protein